MKNVIFVAPYFMDATERFIAAATSVPAARVGLVSCDPVEKLAPELRQRLAGHHRVEGIRTAQLAQGVRALASQLGSADRLLGMLEQIQVSLGEIRDQMQIPGMGATAAANFRDKSQMKDVLRAAGVPCARHQLVENVAAGTTFAQRVGYPVVVKPPAGAGARGIYRCENPDSLADCLQTLDAHIDNPILVEEFIQGQEHSFDSICVDGKLVWSSISHYFPGPLEVVREPWIQWCVIIPRETHAQRYQPIHAVAEPALKALGMQTGLSHMEWFRRDDGSIAISEVGARPPGAQFTSLISYAHDFDLYKAWAHLMIHNHFEARERKYAAGAAYLRGMGPGRVRHVHGLADIARSLGELVVDSRIPEPGQPASSTYEGEGFIIVRHPETRVVEEALRRIITNVKVEMSQAT
ncbi:MAG: ATP-grasp domain-containing protein [Pirellulaceae bacterium]